MQAWSAYGDKMMYGKKTKGVIRSTVWIGPDGVVRKHWARSAANRLGWRPSASARTAGATFSRMKLRALAKSGTI